MHDLGQGGKVGENVTYKHCNPRGQTADGKAGRRPRQPSVLRASARGARLCLVRPPGRKH